MNAATAPTPTELALFPLGSVLFPGGRLSLRVFEARYLDLMRRCLREGSSFGVVTLRQGHEVRQADETVRFDPQGCLAELLDCDAPSAGLLQVQCRGSRRFELDGPAAQGDNGLWQAPVRWLPDDAPCALTPECMAAVHTLRQVLTRLQQQGQPAPLEPQQWDDAGWIANRWCELLPIPLSIRVGLMALQDPLARLRLVDGFLRRHAIVRD
ncbi:MAG: hypothetical protein RJA44_594 [Pseudomonadota bacterium]